MTICPKCSTRNKDNSMNCRSCGFFFPRETVDPVPGNIRQSPPKRVSSTIMNMDQQEAYGSGGGLLEDRIEQNLSARQSGNIPQQQNYYAGPPIQSPPSGNNKMIWIAISVLLLMVAAISVYVVYQPQSDTAMTPSSVFAMAEEFYTEKNYLAALKMYQQFLTDYPGNALASVAASKIDEINSSLVTQEEKNSRINILMAKAESAFQQNRFLKPEENNAMIYVSEVLLLDPTQPDALDMRAQIIDYYDDQAAEAISKNRYDTARKNYEKILTIMPGDTYAQEQITRVEEAISEQARQNAQRRKAARDRANRQKELKRQQDLAKARAAEKARREAEQRRLAEQRRQAEQQRLALEKKRKDDEAARAAQAAANNSLAANTTPASNTNPNVNSSTQQEKPGLSNSNQSETRANKNTIIPAALLDQKIEYLHKEKAKVPRNLDYGGFSLVKAECIVNKRGIVESVSLLTSAQNTRLNNIAIDALKKYRYKVAYYEGQPTRFKVVESINFVRFR